MEMPWTAARDFSAAVSRLERERLLSSAIAHRAAQAGGKEWSTWVKEVSAK